MDELYKVIAKAKLNKAPGYDRIPYEFYKNATDTFLAKVLEFFNTIWAREIIPDNFKRAILFPILKKGDASNPENYRGISFLNSMAKMFAGIILNRLEQFTERGNLLSEAQTGFCPGYSTIDHIFTLENMFHLTVKRGKKMYAVFVDLKAAFDRVSRTALIYKLRILGISTKIVNIIEKLYDTTTASVWNGSNLSEWFETTTGVRQGCILSPLLFALFLNDIVEWLPGGINLGDFVIKILLYAGDICMFAESVDTLQLMLNRLAKYCKTWGLEVNLSKTKVVIFNKHRGRMARNEKWFFNGGPVEVVKEYKYLGIIVTPQMNLKSHLDEKLKISMNAVNATWAKILKAQEVSHSAKFKIFTAAVKSIMLYGAEVWGNQPYDQVEKLLIFFIKRYFWLPVNTPSYMVMLETGLPPLFIDTLRAHYDYLLKVLKYPQGRLAYKTMIAAREKDTGFHYRLQELAEKYQVTVDLDDDEICIKEQLSEIVRKVDLQRRQDYTNQARNSQSRFLYSSLNYDLGRLNYFKDSFTRAKIALIFKTRGELLNLNYHPYKKTDSLECNLCNMRAREDVLHFIGKCPILMEIRLLHLGKAILSLHETFDVLNGNDWTALTNYCFEASSFRTDYA